MKALFSFIIHNSTLSSSSRDCAHDEERLHPIRHHSRQGSVGWFVRHILAADKKPDECAALLGFVLADRSAKHRVLGLERVENCSECRESIYLELHLVTDARQRAQMMRKYDTNHEMSKIPNPKTQAPNKDSNPNRKNPKERSSRVILEFGV
jgi:hypothetical protein